MPCGFKNNVYMTGPFLYIYHKKPRPQPDSLAKYTKNRPFCGRSCGIRVQCVQNILLFTCKVFCT